MHLGPPLLSTSSGKAAVARRPVPAVFAPPCLDSVLEVPPHQLPVAALSLGTPAYPEFFQLTAPPPPFTRFMLSWAHHSFLTKPSLFPVSLLPPPSLSWSCSILFVQVDLTSLPLPVARAAVRWALRRVLAARGVLQRPVPSPYDDDSGEGGGGGAGGWFLAGGASAGGGAPGSGGVVSGAGGGAREAEGEGVAPRSLATSPGPAGGAGAGGDTAAVGDLLLITGVGVAHSQRTAAGRAALARAKDSLLAKVPPFLLFPRKPPSVHLHGGPGVNAVVCFSAPPPQAKRN